MLASSVTVPLSGRAARMMAEHEARVARLEGRIMELLDQVDAERREAYRRVLDAAGADPAGRSWTPVAGPLGRTVALRGTPAAPAMVGGVALTSDACVVDAVDHLLGLGDVRATKRAMLLMAYGAAERDGDEEEDVDARGQD